MDVAAGFPSVDMGAIYKEIATSKDLAETLKGDELKLIDQTITELMTAKKAALANKKEGKPVNLTIRTVDKELAQLKKLKRTIAKGGIQNGASAKTHELGDIIHKALASIGANPNKLDPDVQKLKIQANELNGHIKDVESKLGASIEKCLGYLEKNGISKKPPSRLKQFLTLFQASHKPKDTLVGLEQYAKKVERTNKVSETEVNKRVKLNSESMAKFTKTHAEVLNFIGDDKAKTDFHQEVDAQKEDLSKKLFSKEKLEHYAEQISNAKISLPHLQQAREKLDAGDAAGVKQAIKEYQKHFESELKDVEAALKYQEKAEASWNPIMIAARFAKKEEIAESKQYFIELREQLVSSDRIIAELDKSTAEFNKGTKESKVKAEKAKLKAEQMLGALHANATIRLARLEQGIEANNSVKSTIAELSARQRALDKLPSLVEEGAELDNSSNTQAVTDWQNRMQEQITFFQGRRPKTFVPPNS